MNATKVAVWGHIWKRTGEKNQTNATNVTLHPLMQVLWRHIWKFTVEKSLTNANNVTIHLLRQVIWGHIWKFTVEKSRTNATIVTMHPLWQAIWGHIWQRTMETSKKMQPMWLSIYASSRSNNSRTKTVLKRRKNATNMTLPLLRLSLIKCWRKNILSS